MASSITQARQGTLYLDDRRRRRRSSINLNRPARPQLRPALCGQDRRGRQGEGPRQHGDEYQHRRPRGRSRPRHRPRPGPGHAAGSVFQTGANSRVLETDGEDMQNRDHACFFSAAHAARTPASPSNSAAPPGLNLPSPPRPRPNTTAWWPRASANFDKSGIAELTFPDEALSTGSGSATISQLRVAPPAPHSTYPIYDSAIAGVPNPISENPMAPKIRHIVNLWSLVGYLQPNAPGPSRAPDRRSKRSRI